MKVVKKTPFEQTEEITRNLVYLLDSYNDAFAKFEAAKYDMHHARADMRHYKVKALRFLLENFSPEVLIGSGAINVDTGKIRRVL